MVIGGAIYVFFSPKSYIGIIARKIGFLEQFLNSISVSNNSCISFIRYWLCDFLWAYSLAFCLLLVFDKAKHKYVFPIVVSGIMALTIELLQLNGVIQGTFDWLDILAETAAIILAVIIKRGINNEKT